jgi:hypothetical protein
LQRLVEVELTMTKLILAPFDPSAPGSHAQRMRMLELVDAYEGARTEGSGLSVARLSLRINELILPRLRTDDGTPVAEALAQISADDYDLLVQGMFAATGADTVPLASTATSTG